MRNDEKADRSKDGLILWIVSREPRDSIQISPRPAKNSATDQNKPISLLSGTKTEEEEEALVGNQSTFETIQVVKLLVG